MQLKVSNINGLQNENSEAKNTPANIRLSEVFSPRTNSYLNEFKLFLAYFNTIPNIIKEEKIDVRKANKWFLEAYKEEIKNKHFTMRYFMQSKNAEYDDIFYILYEDLIVYFDIPGLSVKFLFKKTEMFQLETVINGIKNCRVRKVKGKPEISVLVYKSSGIDTKSLQISKPKLNIEDNYNDDFIEIHQIITKRLSNKNDKGLVLLHGKPGTGKTSYIRYLIATLKKNVIFLPPNMAGAITDPYLISILIDNPDCIFVIEDAENIVVDREKDGSSPVAALLNISDGLLSDCLNIQIICSFNTDISKVDSALMRKGRLIAKYEFKELETEKAQLLSDKLLFNSKIYKPMTLTEIYNQDELSFQNIIKRNAIGFKANIN